MRFWASRLLLGSCVFALPATPLSAAMLPEAYDDAVATLQAVAIIDRGNARVHDQLTRAEALKIILRSQPKYASEVAVLGALPPLPLFTDVDQSAWYAPSIEVAFRHSLIRGYPDGRFLPRNGVRVSEAVSMLARTFDAHYSSTAFRTSLDLPNTEGAWYAGAVSTLLSKGAIMPGSRLQLSSFISRGELFDMVYRLRIAYGQTAAAPAMPVVLSVREPTVSAQQNPPKVAVPQTVGSAATFASTKPFAISIPSLGIDDLTITHPQDSTTQKGILAPLKDGVGHLFGYPGEGGKVMVYGHSSGYPWDLSEYTKIFRGINKMVVGERVYVTYKQKLYVYQVTEKRTVPSQDKSAFEPDDDGEELILYTCWPPDSITQRYLVLAKPVSSVALSGK